MTRKQTTSTDLGYAHKLEFRLRFRETPNENEMSLGFK